MLGDALSLEAQVGGQESLASVTFPNYHCFFIYVLSIQRNSDTKSNHESSLALKDCPHCNCLNHQRPIFIGPSETPEIVFDAINNHIV